jgi:hypothetical protein
MSKALAIWVMVLPSETRRATFFRSIDSTGPVGENDK